MTEQKFHAGAERRLRTPQNPFKARLRCDRVLPGASLDWRVRWIKPAGQAAWSRPGRRAWGLRNAPIS